MSELAQRRKAVSFVTKPTSVLYCRCKHCQRECKFEWLSAIFRLVFDQCIHFHFSFGRKDAPWHVTLIGDCPILITGSSRALSVYITAQPRQTQPRLRSKHANVCALFANKLITTGPVPHKYSHGASRHSVYLSMTISNIMHPLARHQIVSSPLLLRWQVCQPLWRCT